MDQIEPEKVDEDLQSETPEDVAVLYSWAKLQGAKYRDFSASRREYRAQMRHRAAEVQRESERRAQADAEAAAAATEKAAREAEQAARFHESAAKVAAQSSNVQESAVEEAASARAMQAAAELARRASAERVEAARRAEAVAAAEAAAKREEREMAEAHASAERQAQRYRESDTRRKAAAGPQPIVAGMISDPYDPFMEENARAKSDRQSLQAIIPEDDMQPTRHRQSRERISVVPQSGPFGTEQARLDQLRIEEVRREQAKLEQAMREQTEQRRGEAGGQDSPLRFYEDEDGGFPKPKVSDSRAQRDVREAYAAKVAAAPFATRVSSGVLRIPQAYMPDQASDARPAYESRAESRATQAPVSRLPVEPPMPSSAVPAWIYSTTPTPEPASKRVPVQPSVSPVEDTLQHSRERVASRWFALKGVFDHAPETASPEAQPQRARDMRVPLLTVFSLAGGVGKTSLVATLGRALSSTGERVLLTDTTSHGLLPFYFGASELKPGVVRTFSPPSGSTDAPIYLVSYDVNEHGTNAAAQDLFSDELTKNSQNMQRILVDMAPGSTWVARRLARMNSTILVPVAPDMNSVISLQAVEKFFGGMTDADGQPVRPFYMLNQFDASLPLHLDVREVMRQQLGERLLPFAIRRSTSVSEALAEGMTVMDYAPDSPVAADYANLVSWLRTQAAPAASGFRNARWSER